jgi:TRAP-type C4-dicarboxylate transport system substrate-binding protein
MPTKRFTHRALAAVLAALATTAAACGGGIVDKVGGDVERRPVVLRFANFTIIQPQLQVFAEEVVRRSEGTLRIEFDEEWRAPRVMRKRFWSAPDAERATIEDVKAGKVDMAWVGARVFDTLGVRSFQALLAPLLVDSYELQGRVFESGIPTTMLEGVGELGAVGIGVLPGPIQRPLGVRHPFLGPRDFDRQLIGGAGNELAAQTFQALGATLDALPPAGGWSLDRLDAAVLQLGGIWGNRYNEDAKYVSANVNLWPRPLVIFAGKKVYESLTPEHRAVLREAAAAAVPGALEAARAEDEETALQLCRQGMTFALASESELAALRGALEPVYADLRADPETRSALDAITNLKTDVAAAAEAPECTSTEPPVKASPIPDGTYETTLTEADYRKAGVSEELGANPGVFRMIFDAGEWTFIGPIREGKPNDDGEQGSYTVFRDQIEVVINAEYKITARWSLDGETLTFTDIDCCGGNAGALAVIWASHPWVKID